MWKHSLSFTVTALASLYAWSGDNAISTDANAGVEHQSASGFSISKGNSSLALATANDSNVRAETSLGVGSLLPANAATEASAENHQDVSTEGSANAASETVESLGGEQSGDISDGLENTDEAAVAVKNTLESQLQGSAHVIADGVATLPGTVQSVQEIALEQGSDLSATAVGLVPSPDVAAAVTSAVNSQITGSVQGAVSDGVNATVNGAVEQAVSNGVNAAVTETLESSVQQSIEQTLSGALGGGL